MNEVWLIAGMFAVTFIVRYPVLALVGRITLPPTVLRALKYVPMAVLTAIIVPDVLFNDAGVLDIRIGNAEIIGAIAAGLIAWRTKNLLLTIVVGMLVFWGWRLLMGELVL